MDLVSKLFVANLFMMIFTLWADRCLLKAGLEEHFEDAMGYWCIFTFGSIPTWVIFAIFNYL